MSAEIEPHVKNTTKILGLTVMCTAGLLIGGLSIYTVAQGLDISTIWRACSGMNFYDAVMGPTQSNQILTTFQANLPSAQPPVVPQEFKDQLLCTAQGTITNVVKLISNWYLRQIQQSLPNVLPGTLA